MIHSMEDGAYIVSCRHDSEYSCCIFCQEQAIKSFIYNNIPRNKWPLSLQNKLIDITREQVIIEVNEYKKSPERTNYLLQRILNRLNY